MGEVVGLKEPTISEDLHEPVKALMASVEEQSRGIEMLIDLVTQLDKRIRNLEIEDRKRSRNSAKIIRVNGEAVR